MELRAAVVEDDGSCRSRIVSCIRRFGKQHNVTVQVTEFADGQALLQDYRAEFDVLFLDIEMPRLDGMSAARQIREMDEQVTIIFITNMAQYAIHGYEVGALDFLLKPVSYDALEMRLVKLLKLVQARQESGVVLTLGTGIRRLRASELLYVELVGHDLVYHLRGESLSQRGSMREAEELLRGKPFFKCNSCYLVNLDHVRAVSGGEAIVGDERLQISRARKKAFIEALAAHLAGV